MEQFYFLSDIGKCQLPTKLQLQEHLDEYHEKIIFVLDSSVCIDIINLVKWKEKANSDKNKIYNLIEYLQDNKIDYFSIFALVESCYNRDTLKIEDEKYCDYTAKLKFAFEFPIKKIKKFDFPSVTSNYNSSLLNFPSELIEDILSTRINVYYSALLKISQISQSNSISKKNAEKNMETFLNWMENDLQIFLGNEYIIALNIFGGNSKFNSMLKIGATKEKILKATLGTAWDSFHARMSINKKMISDMLKKNVYPIFVTKDIMLSKLMSPYVSYYTEREFKKVKIIDRDLIPEFYSKEFMDNLNEKMSHRINEKFYEDTEYDNEKIENVKKIITELEEQLN